MRENGCLLLPSLALDVPTALAIFIGMMPAAAVQASLTQTHVTTTTVKVHEVMSCAPLALEEKTPAGGAMQGESRWAMGRHGLNIYFPLYFRQVGSKHKPAEHRNLHPKT